MVAIGAQGMVAAMVVDFEEGMVVKGGGSCSVEGREGVGWGDEKRRERE